MLNVVTFTVAPTEEEYLLELESTGDVAYEIDFGDGTIVGCRPGRIATACHTYSRPGTYRVNIIGAMTWFKIVDGSDLVVSIDNINSDTLLSLDKTFSMCDRLTTIPFNLFTRCKNLSNVSRMFFGCSKLKHLAAPDILFKNCPIDNYATTFLCCMGLSSQIEYKDLITNVSSDTPTEMLV